MRDIVLPIYNGDHIDDDIKEISKSSRSSDIPLLLAFIQQLSGSEDARWRLIRRKDENCSSPYFNCCAIECFQKRGFNLYRLRPVKSRIDIYRIIYAYDSEYDDIYFLAIVIAKKENHTPPPPESLHYDYAQDNSKTKRIEEEYRAIFSE